MNFNFFINQFQQVFFAFLIFRLSYIPDILFIHYICLKIFKCLKNTVRNPTVIYIFGFNKI